MKRAESTRPLRTLLFVPGDRSRMLERAASLGADVLLLDLEDAVPLAAKEEARRLVKGFLAGRGEAEGPAVFVRLNSLSSGLLEADLEQVVQPGLNGVCLPKVESASDVQRLSLLLEAAERGRGLSPGSLKVVPLIESAKGVIAAGEVASASPRVVAIALGAEDLGVDLGLQRSKEGIEILYARSRMVIAAAAAGVAAVDVVFMDVSDEEGLIRDARLGRQLGFRGKLVIHPRQVGPVKEAFTPSEEEVAQARKIVGAFQEAQEAGSGVILVDGKMVDLPVVVMARKTLEASEG